MDKDTSLLPPLLIAVVLFLCFCVVGAMDFADALTADAIRKDPPRILSYSIQQSSPGMDNGVPMFPLHMPVASADTRAAKNERRSTREQR